MGLHERNRHHHHRHCRQQHNGPTLDLINTINPAEVKILGSATSVSSGIQSQLQTLGYSVERFSGANRYETSLLVNTDAFATTAATVVFVTGVNFPDALAGTPFADSNDAPVYLVRAECVPVNTMKELDRLSTSRVVILGGPDTVSVAVEDLVACP